MICLSLTVKAQTVSAPVDTGTLTVKHNGNHGNVPPGVSDKRVGVERAGCGGKEQENIDMVFD